MTEQKFQSGDVVVLKSGSPKMTVANYISLGLGVVSDNVVCKWFVGNTSMTEEFHQDSLVIDN